MVTSCILGLSTKPKESLELFLAIDSEIEAIDFHNFLYEYLNQDLSQITALEYFGHNSQKYMNNREFLFSNKKQVGIYLQIPIFNNSIDKKTDEWVKILHLYNPNIDLDNVKVLNDPNNWKKFLKLAIPYQIMQSPKQKN